MSGELRLPARDAGLPAIHSALARGCPCRCPSWLPRGIARAWLVALTAERVQRAPGGGRGSGPQSVLDRIKWPVAFHPREDRVVEDRVERGAVGAYPGLDGRVPSALAAARLRVDVHAADDVPGAGAEHGVGEPAAPGEVLRVPLQVAEIVIQGHLARPAAIREPRRPPDVVNAGRPGGVIGLVVLWPERGQP